MQPRRGSYCEPMLLRAISHVFSRPDTVEPMRVVLRELLAATRMEPGCITCELLEGVDDPTDFAFVAEWRSRTDLQEHHRTPHVLTAQARMQDLVADEPSAQVYKVIG